MPKSKARKNVDENFKVGAVQRLQTGGVPANDVAKELGVSIWSLRRWSREYRKRTAAGEGVAGEPATFATASEELPAKPSSEPPVVRSTCNQRFGWHFGHQQVRRPPTSSLTRLVRHRGHLPPLSQR